jgi:hypothetical protein
MRKYEIQVEVSGECLPTLAMTYQMSYDSREWTMGVMLKGLWATMRLTWVPHYQRVTVMEAMNMVTSLGYQKLYLHSLPFPNRNSMDNYQTLKYDKVVISDIEDET